MDNTLIVLAMVATCLLGLAWACTSSIYLGWVVPMPVFTTVLYIGTLHYWKTLP